MHPKVRAVTAVALLWSCVWLLMGIALGTYDGSDLYGSSLPGLAVVWMVWGGVSGAVFAVLLAVAESGRALVRLSLVRSAVWGALGSMTLPAATMVMDVFGGHGHVAPVDWAGVLFLGLSAALGSACAVGTVAVVRRPPHR